VQNSGRGGEECFSLATQQERVLPRPCQCTRTVKFVLPRFYLTVQLNCLLPNPVAVRRITRVKTGHTRLTTVSSRIWQTASAEYGKA
jgi:hypothetical protein